MRTTPKKLVCHKINFYLIQRQVYRTDVTECS